MKTSTFIIAEIGLNHGGNFDKARRMVETATLCGADAVKFQILTSGCLTEYEFSQDQWSYLKAYCDELGTDFLCTAHWGSPLCGYKEDDYPLIDFVDTLVQRHKIASPYVTNEKYVKYIASKGKPVLMATGSLTEPGRMASDKQIWQALEWLGNLDITLMHCVSEYPAKWPHYERIRELKNFGHRVGLSDHTQKKVFPPMDAIEKHFKVDDDCVDAAVSLNPKDFNAMVTAIRNFETSYPYAKD